MDMTLRWYGPGYDSVTLKQIRQIPGVKNVITTLFGKQAGERWLPEEIAELKRIVEDAGSTIPTSRLFLTNHSCSKRLQLILATYVPD